MRVAHVGRVTDGTRSEREGRSDIEVVEVTDTTEARRSIDEDTSSLHLLCKCIDLVVFRRINVHSCSVASAALEYQLFADVECFFEVVCLVHTEESRQLLASPWIVVGSVVCLVYENLRFHRNFDASHLCEMYGRLTYSCRLNTVVLRIEEYFCNLVCFVLGEEVAASVLHESLNFFVNVL